jgi:hypothetical protein
VFTRCHRCDGVYRFLSAAGNDRDYDSIGSGVTHTNEKPSEDDPRRSTEVIGWSRHRRRKTFGKSLECRKSKRALSDPERCRVVEKNGNGVSLGGTTTQSDAKGPQFEKTLSSPHNSTTTMQTNMIRNKFITVIAITWACVAASSLNAATIPAGTTLNVSTASSISSKDPVGRTFAAQIDRDVAIKGTVLLKAGTKAFGKITSSRANPRKSEPLSLELTSISVNGRNVAVKTNSVQPGSPTITARQAQYGHTAGTLLISPGTKMQFQLAQAVTL